jgi:hypothetical protein
MTQTADNNVGLNSGWLSGAAGWKAGTDNNFILLGRLVQPNVISDSVTAPPGSPAAGDAYIVPTGASGAWTGNAGHIAVWSGASLATPGWVFAVPINGWETFVVSRLRWNSYNGTAWVASRARGANKPVGVGAIAGGALSLDLSQGAAFDVTLTAPVTTFTIANPAPAPDATSFKLRVRQDATGGRTLVLPTGTKTPGAAGYTVSAAANAIDLLEFVTYDAGTTWYLVASKAFA